MATKEQEQEKTVLSHAAHSAQVMRSAIKRELESEMRGLLMAAQMHGFHLTLADGVPVATDLKAAP